MRKLVATALCMVVAVFVGAAVNDPVAADVATWVLNHEAALPSGAEAARSQPDLARLWGSKRR